MASPADKLTNAQIYGWLQKIWKRLTYLEQVVSECCKGNTSFSTGFRGKDTTSNTGGFGSSRGTDSSSGIGSQLTTGTGSDSVPQSSGI